MTAGKIHIGTSGWSYKHWRERFYPATLKPEGYLGYYAHHFQVTEINTSFYHLPKTSTVEQWAGTVNARFKFCPKISRYITHIKKLNDPEVTLPRFFDIFDPVQRHLGPVLLQLPPSLGFHEEKAVTFFEALGRYPQYTFALEPRHDSWLSEEAVAILKHYKIAFVIADSGKRWPGGELVTANHIYIRFHGPDGSYAKSYPERVLESYAEKMIAWRKEGHHVWAFFNNDGNAYAIANAERLMELTES